MDLRGHSSRAINVGIQLLVLLTVIGSSFCRECNGIKSFDQFDRALSINKSMLSDLTTFFNRTELEAVLEDNGYTLTWDTGDDSVTEISNSSHPWLKEFAIIQLDSLMKQMAKFWPEVYIELPEPLDAIWTWDTRVRDGFFIDQRIADERMLRNKTYQYVTKEITMTMHQTLVDLHEYENATSDALNQAMTFFDRKYLMALFSPTYRIVSWINEDDSTTIVREGSHRLLKGFVTIVLHEMMEQLDCAEKKEDKISNIFKNFWDLNSGETFFLFRQFSNQTWDLRESPNMSDI